MSESNYSEMKGNVEINDLTDSLLINKTEQKEAPSVPVLYSKEAILLCSIFATTLFGGIVFALNLIKIKKEQLAFYTIIGSFIYFVLSIFISILLLKSSIFFILKSFAMYSFLGLDVLGGLLLSRTLWNKYIGKDIVYKQKSILVPIIIYFSICFLLTAFLVFWFFRAMRNIG